MFPMPNKKPAGDIGAESSVNPIPKEWEVRPGGMLVQKRDYISNHSIPTIKVRVKYGSIHHEIHISSQASFGELKKILTDHTGLHPLDQKLIYKKKERDSKTYLDIAKVKDGSKIMLVEDLESKERRCLEKLKNAKTEKFSKSLSQIGLEVDKFYEQIAAIEKTISRGIEVEQMDVDNLTGQWMNCLVKLDEMAVIEDLKLQKKMMERKVQKYIETLDAIKLNNTMLTSQGGDKILGKQREKEKMQEKQKSLTTQIQLQQQQQTQRTSKSVVFTTRWETFD